MYLPQNLGFFKIHFFYLEDIDLVSPKLQKIEIFSQTTSQENLVILAFIGAELAEGGGSAPHSRVSNSEPHSRAQVNKIDKRRLVSQNFLEACVIMQYNTGRSFEFRKSFLNIVWYIFSKHMCYTNLL